MADFTYTTVPGKLKQLFAKLREVGVPSKATVQWLKSIGFTSSNDASMLGVLKTIGFVDATGVPTPKWSSFRGANSKRVLGDAIRDGYAELFAVYPNAPQRSQTDLEHVFSTSSTGGRQVISKLVSTFKSLAELAEFTPVSAQTDLHLASEPLHVPISAPAAGATGARGSHSGGPSVHIDIQVHIAPESSADQIDQIFASMAKHLYGGRDRE
ncbi:MAG: DUF5343 domain-containing protein [Vicinamibacterales bacterium]|jgi:hypothetical protein